MITLYEYGRRYHCFASHDDVLEHLRRTVFQPLEERDGPINHGRSEKEELFAFPPIATNFRLTGEDWHHRMEAISCSTRSHMVRMGDPLGMACCITVVPSPGIASLGILEMESQKRVGEVHSWLAEGSQKSPPAAPPAVVVVLDVGCAEAVLRGSDVFAPGVLSSTAPFHVGDRVLLCCGIDMVEEGVEGGRDTDDTGPGRAGRGSLGPPLTRGSLLDWGSLRHSDVAASASSRSRRVFILVGEGTAAMTRKEVFTPGARGTALRTVWTPFHQLSTPALQAMLGMAGATPPPFLQNYSSMVPPWVLVSRVWGRAQRGEAAGRDRDPLAFLDACAAPGGKTSLLLSLLAGEAFTVMCCERSQSRFRTMVDLLHSHFGDAFVADHLKACCGDVSAVLCAQGLGDRASPTAPDGGSEWYHWPSRRGFDGILLDPPCTGLGLRPKLLPHTVSLAEIHEAAAYQRKLFASCVAAWPSELRWPRRNGRAGTLVYSTCTITLEENEANVLWALQTFPFLRLARAASAMERQLWGADVTRHGDGRCILLEEEIMALQRSREGGAVDPSDPVLVLRFMPKALRYSCAGPDAPALGWWSDTVGFFVAVFEQCPSAGSD